MDINNSAKHTRIIGVFIVLLVISIGGYFVWNGFSFKFPPPCSYYEIPLDLDEQMKNYEVVFQQPIYIWNTGIKYGKPSEGCPNMLTDVPRELSTINFGAEISANIKFKFIRRAVIGCNGWDCISADVHLGDNILLEDGQGVEYRISTDVFHRNPPAFYYGGNLLIGEVKILKYYNICYTGGDERNLCTRTTP